MVALPYFSTEFNYRLNCLRTNFIKVSGGVERFLVDFISGRNEMRSKMSKVIIIASNLIEFVANLTKGYTEKRMWVIID